MTDHTESTMPMHSDAAEIGWVRGVLTGLAVLVVGVGIAVFGADQIITRLTSLSRTSVEYVASAFFVVVVIVAAWVLRRLQARGLI